VKIGSEKQSRKLENLQFGEKSSCKAGTKEDGASEEISTIKK
jgi:hypothetical protein